jgi:hypothetical protein
MSSGNSRGDDFDRMDGLLFFLLFSARIFSTGFCSNSVDFQRRENIGV